MPGGSLRQYPRNHTPDETCFLPRAVTRRGLARFSDLKPVSHQFSDHGFNAHIVFGLGIVNETVAPP